jgi:hypothetical protein
VSIYTQFTVGHRLDMSPATIIQKNREILKGLLTPKQTTQALTKHLTQDILLITAKLHRLNPVFGHADNFVVFEVERSVLLWASLRLGRCLWTEWQAT